MATQCNLCVSGEGWLPEVMWYIQRRRSSDMEKICDWVQ